MTQILQLKSIRFCALAVVLSYYSTAIAQEQSQYDKGTPPQHAAGVSALGSYASTDLGTINLGNGALNFKIPLGTVGGRGFSIPLTLNYSSKVWSASMDSDHDHQDQPFQAAFADYSNIDNFVDFFERVGPGWTIGAAPIIYNRIVRINKLPPGGPNGGCYTFTVPKLTVMLPDKGEIEFRDDAYDGAPLSSDCGGWVSASRGKRWHATDGSGTIYISDADNAGAERFGILSGVVITSDGMRYRFSGMRCDSITDRNGNKIQINYTPSPVKVEYVDQLGRVTSIQQTVADPDNPSVTLAVLVTFPGYNGNRYFKIKRDVMSQHYRSDVTPSLPVVTGNYDPLSWGYSNWWGPSPTLLFPHSYGLFAQRLDNQQVLTEVTLPDQRPLRFNYNEFGEVAEVQLPTGGKVWYDYEYSDSTPVGNSPLWEIGGDYHTVVEEVDRTLVQRRVFDGSSLECTWNYHYLATETDVSAQSPTGVAMLNERHLFLPSGRYTEYIGNAGAHDGTQYSLWSTGVEWRTETRNGNAVLTASEQDWTQRTPLVWATYPQEQPTNDNRVNQLRRYLDDGSMAKTETSYDQYNNPTEVKEYDYDQTLKRRTVTQYLTTNNNSNYVTDDSIHLLSFPVTRTVYADLTQNRIAQTVYEYDVYMDDTNHDHAFLTDYSPVSQHDSSYNALKTARGNATRVGQWLNTTSGFIYSYPRYDILGNVVSAKDPKGNVTTISFTDDFGNGSNPGSRTQNPATPTYALPTLITSPPPMVGAPVHTASSQYDFSTGLLTGFRDRNSVVTQTIYSDPFNRPTLVKSALEISGVESHTAMYYAPATVLGVTLTKNDVLTTGDLSTPDDASLRSWTVTDGFGRTKEQWSRDPQGDVKVVTIYDALSRASQTSNPFRPALGESALLTTIAYDLAGRTTTVTTPDSAIVTSTYSGNTVTVSDQTSKKRKSVTDALGRLKQIYEDPDNLNYLTSYEYDALDNLAKVTQDNNPQNPQQPPRVFAYDSLKRLTSATNPESGTVSYQYDDNGNLTQKTDARLLGDNQTHIRVTYEYDALNRPKTRSYNDGPASVTYSYDATSVANSKGRLTNVGSSVSSYSYGEYDALGRIKTCAQTTDGTSYSMSYSYNLAAMTSQTYPSGRVVASVYDNAGRLAGVKNQATGMYYAGAAAADTANRIQYTAHGAVGQMRLGNSLWEHTNFNSRLQPVQIGLGTAGNNSSVLQLDYSYGTSNNNGNVQSQTISLPGGPTLTQTYGYDQLNRLLSAQEMNGGNQSWQQVFTYFDQNGQNGRYGNRRIDATNTTPGLVTENPRFDPTTNRIQPQAGEQYAYDPAGNLTKNQTGHTFAYDAENRQTSYDGGNPVNGGASYAYDGDGRRVKKLSSSGTTIFVYNALGQLVAEYSDPQPTSSGTSYLTADSLGTPRVITNSNGSVIGRHDYLPFGEEIAASYGGRSAVTGYPATDSVRQQFTLKERDIETGLDYFGARYYASTQGRFTSIDPYNICREAQITAQRDPDKAAAQLAKYLSSPQQWNRYAYVANNPLKYIDPTGEFLELTGATQEERDKAFERLKAMVGKQAGQHLSVSVAYDLNKKAHYYVGSDKNLGEVGGGQLGGYISQIIDSNNGVEFKIADSFSTKFRNYQVLTAGNECGGACTVGSEESLTGKTQIFVNADASAYAEQKFNVYTNAGAVNPTGAKLLFTNDIVDSHEFGHAFANAIEGMPIRYSTASYYRAVQFENLQRDTYSGPEWKPRRTRE